VYGKVLINWITSYFFEVCVLQKLKKKKKQSNPTIFFVKARAHTHVQVCCEPRKTREPISNHEKIAVILKA